jgi:GNAT superfamily N-acetyltransferase
MKIACGDGVMIAHATPIASSGLIPTSPLHAGRVKKITVERLKQLVTTHHYLGNKPFRCCAAYGIESVQEELLGGIAFHGVSAPETAVSAFGLARSQQHGLLEIGRLVLVPHANGANYGSRLISIALQLLRKEIDIRAVITYADSSLHRGAVYRASNFTYCGLSKQKNDFYVEGKIKERGRTKGVTGEWRPRSRKHRYVRVFDSSLILRWPSGPNVDLIT